MNMSIEKMLSHVYEIEGLMLVTRRLGEENTPEVITNKIHRKVRELAEMCGVDLKPETAPEVPSEVSEPTVKPEAPEPQEQPAGLPENVNDADGQLQPENGEEFKEVSNVDYEEPRLEPDEVPVADREPDDDITVEFIEEGDDLHVVEDDETLLHDNGDEPEDEQPETEPETAPSMPVPPPFRISEDDSDEPVPEPDPAIVPEADDEPDITVEFIEAEETLPEPEDMPVPPVPTEFPEVDEPTPPLRVDQKLQRALSRDINKAFSVNDRFRFQRELFAGSADALNTAIEHIKVMTSYGNAELYFFSQLGWDRENEAVQDFMNIVRNHFQSH